MSSRFPFAASLFLIGATILCAQNAADIEGSKAGEGKELVPGIAFHWCPAGTFTMGDGDNEVEVELTTGYWLGETEVTQGQWQKLMGTTPWRSGRIDNGFGNVNLKEAADYPASFVSQENAMAFCDKLTSQERDAGRLPQGWKFTLPTEAQWEYACRAGTQTTYSFGDHQTKLSEYGWCDVANARKVGLKKPNAWGLKDMHGNVWEWCSDWWDEKLAGGQNPVGPAAGKNPVIRGGSFIGPAANCTSANRFYYNGSRGNEVQGFRIAAIPA